VFDVVRRLVREDGGQDVVEYALLTAFIGLCAVAIWPTMREAIGYSYSQTTAGVQGLWEPPPPSGSSGS
jgi:Flp pilus assembly pilin Flp